MFTSYRIIRRLSLDIVFGVLCGAAYFSSLTNQKMPWQWWIILPIVVWIIYTADHILDDLWLIKKSAQNTEHFYLKHRRLLSGLMLLHSLVGIALVTTLPIELLLSGILLFPFVIFYFIHVHLRRKLGFSKDITIAFVYVAAISSGPIILTKKMNVEVFMLVFVYLLLVLLNVLLLKFIKLPASRKQWYDMKKILYGYTGIITILMMVSMLFISFTYTTPLLMVVIIYFHLISSNEKHQLKQHAGVLADAALFIPGVAILF